MANITKMERLILELNDSWMGKNGVTGIYEEQKGKEKCIRFLVRDLINYKTKLPKEYKGVKIEWEEVGDLTAFV
jgi:hypothetical protein